MASEDDYKEEFSSQKILTGFLISKNIIILLTLKTWAFAYLATKIFRYLLFLKIKNASLIHFKKKHLYSFFN